MHETAQGNYVTINEFNVSDMVEFEPEWTSDEII